MIVVKHTKRPRRRIRRLVALSAKASVGDHAIRWAAIGEIMLI